MSNSVITRNEFRLLLRSMSYSVFCSHLYQEQKPYNTSLLSHIKGSQSYYIGSYLKYKRRAEFFLSKSNIIFRIWGGYNWFLMNRLSIKLGYQIPLYTCDWCLKLVHFGTITINREARIGKNLTIYPGSNIGEVREGEDPIIGDNCYLGINAVVSGKVIVGINVMIAPNAVVTKDVPDNAIVGGIPAKIIKFKNQ